MCSTCSCRLWCAQPCQTVYVDNSAGKNVARACRVCERERKGVDNGLAAVGRRHNSSCQPFRLSSTPHCCQALVLLLMNMTQAQTQPLFPLSRAPRKLAVSGRAPGRPSGSQGHTRPNAPFLLPARAGAGGIRTRPPKVTTPPCRGHKEQCRRSCESSPPLPAPPDGDENLHLVINEVGEAFIDKWPPLV